MGGTQPKREDLVSKQPFVQLAKRIGRSLARTEGQSLVLVALSMVAVMGVAGVGISIATVYSAQSKLQNATDAAALAGAQELEHGGSVSQESSLISTNAPGATGTVSVDAQQPDEVVATAAKVVNGTFASLFGFHTFTVKTRSVAKLSPGDPFDYAVFQGSPSTTQPLTFNGNDAVQYVGAQGGSSSNVFSNGNTDINGSVTITGAAEAVGSVTVEGGGAKVGQVQNNAQPISMPQWNIPLLPNTSTWTVVSSLPSNTTLSGNYLVDGSVTLQGDTVNGSIMSENGGSITLNGSNTINGNLYASGGGGVSITNTDTVNGNIQVGNNPTSTPSTITLTGGTVTGYVVDTGGNIVLAGTASAGSSPGLTLAAFDENGVGGNITLEGSANVTGVLYAPDGSITFSGGSNLTGAAVANFDTLNGNVNVSYSANVVQSAKFQQVWLVQ